MQTRHVQTTVDVKLWRRYKVASIELGIPLRDLLRYVLLNSIDALEADAYLSTLKKKEK